MATFRRIGREKGVYLEGIRFRGRGSSCRSLEDKYDYREGVNCMRAFPFQTHPRVVAPGVHGTIAAMRERLSCTRESVAANQKQARGLTEID